MVLIVYADGACRGNPGPMAIGASIQALDGGEIATVSALSGPGTNNIAEYQAAIAGVKAALDYGAEEIEPRMDSQLVVKQISGEFRVEKAELRPLHSELSYLPSSESY